MEQLRNTKDQTSAVIHTHRISRRQFPGKIARKEEGNRIISNNTTHRKT